MLGRNADQSQSIDYFNDFSEAEIREFEEKYQCTRSDMLCYLNEHRGLYHLYLFKQFLVNYGSNAIYMEFPIKSGNQGLNTAAQVLFPSIGKIPYKIAYGIGTPIAIIDVISYSFVFSIRKAAIKDMLEAKYNPLSKQMKSYADYIKLDPIIYLPKLIARSASWSLLVITNLTGTVPELIYILPMIRSLALRWALSVFVFYLGYEYYRGYTNANYFDGLRFIRDSERISWLSWQRKAISVEMMLQMLSTIIIRSNLFMYFARVAAQSDQLAFWFNQYLVCAFIIFQTMMVYARTIFESRIGDRQHIINHLSRHPEFDALVRQQMSFQQIEQTPANIKREKQDLIQHVLAQYKDRYLEEHGYSAVFKKYPVNVIYVLFRLTLGGYMGYLSVPSSINRTLGSCIAVPLGAGLIGGSLLSAEVDKLACQEYKSHRIPEESKGSSYSRNIIIFSVFLTCMSGFATALANIGTLSPDLSEELKAVFVIICIEQMLSSIQLNLPKTRSTAAELYNALPSLKNCFSCLFKNNRSVAPMEMKEVKHAWPSASL